VLYDFEPEGGDSKSLRNFSCMLFLSLVLYPEDVVASSTPCENIKGHLVFTCPLIEAYCVS
jgi:hypothetical protein